MKKVVKLKESDLQRIVKKVLSEGKYLDDGQDNFYDDMERKSPDNEDFQIRQKRKEDEYYKWERFKELDKYNDKDEFYDDMEKNSPDDEDFQVRQKRREDEYEEWVDYLQYYKK